MKTVEACKLHGHHPECSSEKRDGNPRLVCLAPLISDPSLHGCLLDMRLSSVAADGKTLLGPKHTVVHVKSASASVPATSAAAPAVDDFMGQH
jgi:hypothetical protein